MGQAQPTKGNSPSGTHVVLVVDMLLFTPGDGRIIPMLPQGHTGWNLAAVEEYLRPQFVALGFDLTRIIDKYLDAAHKVMIWMQRVEIEEPRFVLPGMN